MTDRTKIILDAGHGGRDPGAVYYGRQEKDDVLNLTMAVGNLLADEGLEVVYTRIDDTFNTPYEKAVMGNESEADYFVSIHRNAMPKPNTGTGVESLVFDDGGAAGALAENINASLETVGFKNRGIIERPGLVVLRRTEMPSVMVEVGFIDNEKDNQLFDKNFQAIAEAIAKGILTTVKEKPEPEEGYYQVQVASYQNRGLADQLLVQLQSEGYPAFLVYEGGYNMVRVGAFENLENAVEMERMLRADGYTTFLVDAKKG